jgi:hypothetical protein
MLPTTPHPRDRNPTTTSLGSQRSSNRSAFANSMGSVFSRITLGTKDPGRSPFRIQRTTGEVEAPPRKRVKGRSTGPSHITTGHTKLYHYKGTFTTTPSQTTLEFEWTRKDRSPPLTRSFSVEATSHDDLFNKTYTQCSRHDLPTEMQEHLLRDIDKHFG